MDLANFTEHNEWLSRVFTNTSLGARLLHRLDLTNLRHIFYLITPYETSVSTLDQVPNYNIQVSVWWVTLIFLEFVVLKISKHEDRFALNDTITSFSAGMMSQMFKFGGRTIAIFIYVWIWNRWRLIELPWESPWTWIFCLLFQDLLYYIEAGFFWGLHTIHHSSEYYNLSTALRQAAVQDAGLAIYDVLQAFFIPPPIFLVHRYFSEIFQFWLHTSLLGRLGPLGIVFNTPSYHRVHHGRNPYCIDRNYGGVLIIWDKMFHTFAEEREDDPPIYGLIHNEKSFNQLHLQFHTLKELLFDKWRMKNRKGEPIFPTFLDKLRAVYYPPGWFPGIDVEPFFHWFTMVDHTEGVPEVTYPVVKYNPPLKLWIKVYCVAHFLLLLCIFMHFEYDRNELEYLDFTLKIAFFVCTMQSFGAFFDLRWFAPHLEIFRGIGVIGYYVAKLFDKDGILPNRIFMISFFGVSTILWTAYAIRSHIVNNKVSADNSDKDVEKKAKSDLKVIATNEQLPFPKTTIKELEDDRNQG
ncbi:Fatty acid hydroxylase domain-containing protein [Aphelenchoides bicaudatus]|nr:Fatty acid hydroxylase domain-containing protein [Aphelenchoides bicaudatus]